MTVTIGTNLVGRGLPTFTIAEIGINHNGSIGLALDLIDAAAHAGVQAVKFQKRSIPHVYSAEERQTPRTFDRSFIENAFARMSIEGVTSPVFPEPGQHERLQRWLSGEDVPTYNGDLKYALEFGPKEWDLIRMRCQELDISWGASPWDGISVYDINGAQPDFHKIASACLPNESILKRVRTCGLPVILSTGGSTMEQIRKAVEVLGRDKLVILHCVATYPSTDDEANMRVIETLQEEFHNVPIGYSGHEQDILASKLAVSLGACVVERHITLDCNLPGSDQKASIEPDMFREMIDEIRRIETMRGTQRKLPPENWASPDELSHIETLLGSGEKRVQDREVSVMKKLRRVEDF